ncbi:MAG: DUF350 domain-containing protein [Pseudomonadales bacterium]|nr:DUF350 domain-containing protein [Pseudomonadales bacterium]
MDDILNPILQNIESVDVYIYQLLLIDLTIAVVMIAGLRFITGLVANVNSAEELASRDNFAFGIAMAAGIISLALMLTGAVSGEPAETYLSEVVSVLSYGLLGLVLIKAGRFFQDKLLFTEIEIQAEIKAGNLATAFVDAANTIATGLVLRAVMLWVESDTLDGLLVVLAAFVLTQLLLGLVTKYRLVVYARRHSGASLQQAFKEGQVALSIRFFGHLIGVALALTAASGVVSYNADNLVVALLLWSGITLVFAVLVSLLAILARSVILMGVDVVEEVNQQNNIGVAAIEASIYIAVGLFFTALFN